MSTRQKYILWKIGLLVIGVVLTISMTGCDTQNTENTLAAAGFKVKLADTPEKLEHLATLPQRKLVSQEHEGNVYYVYADAKNCKCMYVGDETAHQQYQKLVIKQNLAAERLEAQERFDSPPYGWGFCRAWGPRWYGY